MRFLDIFRGELPSGYTQIKVGNREMFVKGDPAGLYNNVRKKIGFKKKLDYLPFEPESASSISLNSSMKLNTSPEQEGK